MVKNNNIKLGSFGEVEPLNCSTWKGFKFYTLALGLTASFFSVNPMVNAQDFSSDQQKESLTKSVDDLQETERFLAPFATNIVEYATHTTSNDVDEYDFDGDVDRFNGNVIDVTALSSTLAVVVYRPKNDDTKVYMSSIKVNTNGTLSILSTYTYTGNVWGLKVEKLSSSRICIISSHPSLSTGLTLKVYDVNTSTGAFTFKDSETAGYTADVEATVMFEGSTSRVVTSVLTYDIGVKHIVWDISSTGVITRQGDATTSGSSIPAVTTVSSTKMVTGVRNSSGKLYLQLWELATVSGKITPVLKDSEEQSQETGDIGLTKITTTRFAVSFKQTNNSNKQRNMVFNLTGTGSNTITKADEVTLSSDITQIDAATTTIGSTGRYVTAAKRDSGTDDDELYLNVFDVTSSGDITRSDFHYGSTVNQMRIRNLSSSRFITVQTRKSDSRLIISVWDITTSSPVDDVTGVNNGVIEETSALSQAFPNPSNGFIQIPFTLEKGGMVSLEILNMAGQKIATVFNGEAKPGKNVKEFNTSEIPAGVYIYKLTSNVGTYVRKMEVTK